MQRIPEPELMDNMEQACTYAGGDFSEPNHLFHEIFAGRFRGYRGNRILDLGCGPADITIRFARAYPDAELVGVDGAGAMLGYADKALAAAGLGKRVRLIHERIGTDMALPAGWADAVISNSLLHHLADPLSLWRTVQAYGENGAAVLIMDLLRPASPAMAQAIVTAHSGEDAEILREDFYNSLLAAYRPEEIREQLDSMGLGHFRIEVVSDRHYAVHGRLG